MEKGEESLISRLILRWLTWEFWKLSRRATDKNKPYNNVLLSLPVTSCAGYNTNLASKSNISEKMRANIAFTTPSFKEYSISFLMISRLIDFALAVLQLLMFNVCGVIGISKIMLFNFSGTERDKLLNFPTVHWSS